MPVRLDEMDTSNNREAEGGSFSRRRSVDMSDAFMQDYDALDAEAETPAEDMAEGGAEEAGFPLTEDQLLRLVQSAFNQGRTYQEQVLQPRWLSSYNAFNNKHSSDSKYSSARFRGRSRLFRPKTRATARKKQAEAAAALFSTADAVLVKAMDESNDQQRAGAELIGELLRFRLDRANENSGIPWFQISMGAHMSAQQTGVCISKQYWEYRRELEGYDEIPVMQVVPPELQPYVGQASIQIGSQQRPRYRILRDRPRIDLIPPEDVIRDPTAAWEDQAQDSAYLILRFPMTVESARTFLSGANDKSRVRFYDVTDEQLVAASGGAADPSNADNVRRAREQNGTDRLSDFTVDQAYRQVWLHENFFRIEGHDYCFWTLGSSRLISDVLPVEEAYPEQGGGRPIVIGVGALEPFKIDPMSPVESWQELQREMNDLVNLRLDTLKQTIAPLAKVRRGRSVDIRAIQNRTPDTVVYMQDLNDVEFDRPQGVASESYIEMEKLNADFDDQAGNFSTGSVQTNRQLGETVGGMQMMMSNANALGEFDLRVWVETWVEPALRQLVKLEQYYENDDKVIAISAKRAKLMPRFNISAVSDEMLTSQVAISVDVGIGSSDPMISLQKFQQASQIVLGVLGQGAQMRLKQDAVIDEVFGKAGYKDASERFFNPSDEQDPRVMQMQQALQQMQDQLTQMGQELKSKQGEQETRIKVARIGAVASLAKQEMSQQHLIKQAFTDAALNQVGAEQDRQFEAEQGDAQHARSMEMEQVRSDTAGVPQIARQPDPEADAAGPGGAPMQQTPQAETLQSLLGIEPHPHMVQAAQHAQAAVATTQQAMAALQQQGRAFQAALAALMEQMDGRFAELGNAMAQSNAQTVQAIQNNGQQTLNLMRNAADDQRQAINDLKNVLSAPKKIVRGADGFASHVVVDMPNQQER